jgi:hypothetical protein
MWKSSTYATVGTVCPAALLGGLVDLDVLDDQVAGVKTLGVGVGLGVLEEREKELSALGGPAGLGDTESLAFRIRISIRMSQCLLAFAFAILSWISPGIPISVCILAHGYRQHPLSRGLHVPWAVRPVLPAYLLMGTASTWPLTFSRYWRARVTFQPLMA